MGEENVKSVENDKVVAEEKHDDSKAINAIVGKVSAVSSLEENRGGSVNRDAALAQVETDKKNSIIKAWEESEKSKAENKASMKMSSITTWEHSKQASLEAELIKFAEALEEKKAGCAEKIKNKIATIHREAEEKRAMVEAKREEEVLKVEETTAKYRALGIVPKKGSLCFGS